MKDTFEKAIGFIQQRKWVLAGIPLVFCLVFLITLPREHKGKLETGQYTYVGQIKNDAPNGEGTITYKNGDKYVGSFKMGKFDGKGTFTSAKEKWQFSGNFKDGVANGKGTMTTSDKKTHQVTFENGVIKK